MVLLLLYHCYDYIVYHDARRLCDERRGRAQRRAQQHPTGAPGLEAQPVHKYVCVYIYIYIHIYIYTYVYTYTYIYIEREMSYMLYVYTKYM